MTKTQDPRRIPLLLSVLFASATFLAACRTTAGKPHVPSPIEVLPQEVLTTPIEPDEKIMAQELRAIEAAFARRSCGQVREHEVRLAPLRKGSLSLPTSTAVALAVCEAEAAPANKAKNERAVMLLGEAQKNLVPAYNFLFLEDLKAQRLEALGDTKRQLEAKKRMRAYIGSLDTLLIQVDGDILRLSGGAEQLSAEQKTRLAEAMRLWPKDDKLFDALKILDDLLAQVVNAEARALILETRTLVLARIEDDFARESALVETRIKEGREPEAREQATRMRARFPRESYGRRIDALLGIASTPPGRAPGSDAALPSAAGATSLSAAGSYPATSDGGVPLTSEATESAARRALDAGKPDESLRILQALPEGSQTDKTRRLRREALDVHVRNTRAQVRDLYNRAGATADPARKADILREGKKLLEELLAKHPDAPGRSGIERNLRTINQDLEGTPK